MLAYTIDIENRENTISQDFLVNLSGDRLLNAVEQVVRLLETGAPPAALAMALQVWYHTLSGNTFSQSIPNAADARNMSRNFALKGRKILEELGIVTLVNKREGFTDEYELTDLEQWQQYTPPVPDRDTRTKKVLEFPTLQGETSIQDSTEPIPDRDVRNDEALWHHFEQVETEPIPVEDTNKDLVVVFKEFIEQQQEVSVLDKDTPSSWQLDQETEVEIQRQMSQERLTALGVVKRAIAFSKVPLLVLEAIASVGNRLLDACWETESRLVKTENNPKPEDDEVVMSIPLLMTLQTMGVILTSEQKRHCLTQYGEDAMEDAVTQLKKTGELVNYEDKTDYFLQYLSKSVMGVPIEVKQREVIPPKKKGLSPVANVIPSPVAEKSKIPEDVMQRLKEADIHLVPATAERLWAKYPERFDAAIAYTITQGEAGKIKQSRAGYFKDCVEQGWLVKNPEPKKRDPYDLTTEQQEWLDWAVKCGLCDGRPVRNYGLTCGEIGILIFEAEFNAYSPPMPISRAMQRYPME